MNCISINFNGHNTMSCIYIYYSFSFCGSGKFYCSSYGETLLRVLGEMLEHDDLEVSSLLYQCLMSSFSTCHFAQLRTYHTSRYNLMSMGLCTVSSLPLRSGKKLGKW